MRDPHLNPRTDDPGSPLPDPLGVVLRDPVDERAVVRVWERIGERRRAHAGMRLGTMLAWASLGAGIGILAMLVFVVLPGNRGREREPITASPAGPLVLEDGRALTVVDVSSTDPPRSIDLADGSRLVLAPGARLEPLASSGREFIVRLGHGTTRFDVEPGGPRRWIIEAGIASIEVVGTRFSVTREPDLVRVDVERGVVLVRGPTVPDNVARLDAGGSIEVRAALRSEIPTTDSVESVPGKSAGPTPPTGKNVWREHAADGDYPGAYLALGAGGLEREATQAGSADELFTLADVARLSGHPSEATHPLEELLARYPTSPRAALAAVTLGRTELGLGRPARASAALDRALALGAPAGLQEDVYARLVEAHMKAGNRSAAVSAAAEYARRFPRGRRKADIERWLAR